MNRLHMLGALVGFLVLCTGCGGSSALDNTSVPVFITIEVKVHNPEVNLCSAAGPNGGEDLTVQSMDFVSKPKNPNDQLSNNQDVNLNKWVVTPSREDGGTVTSPEWTTNVGVFVAAGGTTSLLNYRIYGVEYLNQSPFIYLLPENGGFDPETGQEFIRESMRFVVSGRTVSGKSITTQPGVVDFRFFCN